MSAFTGDAVHVIMQLGDAAIGLARRQRDAALAREARLRKTLRDVVGIVADWRDEDPGLAGVSFEEVEEVGRIRDELARQMLERIRPLLVDA